MEKKYYSEYLEKVKVVADNQFEKQNHSLIGGTIEASEGLIVDIKAFNASLDNYFSSFNQAGILENQAYQQYKEDLERLNYLSRRAQYYSYATTTNEQIEAFKQNELKSLTSVLSRVEATASASGLNLNQNVNATPFDITSRPVSKGSYKRRPFTITESAISLVDSYQNERDQSRKSILEKMAISEYQSLKDKLNVIMNLTPEQYKAYRISQIALSQEEINQMNLDLQNNPDLIQAAAQMEAQEVSAGRQM